MQDLRMNIKIMKAVVTTADTKIIATKEDEVRNVENIGEAAVVAMSKVI